MGLVFLIVNFGYLLFSIIVGVVVSKILFHKTTITIWKRRSISILVLLLVLFLPFWDLLIQKGIKTYYEKFRMEEKIYVYPEKDKNGKVESLGIDKIFSTNTISYFLSKKELKELKNKMITNKYVELYVFGIFDNTNKEKNYKENLGYVRVNFVKEEITYELINGTNDFISRYQILTHTNNYYFHNETIVEFWDKQNNTLMSNGLIVNFPVKNAETKFRTKYLIWWLNAGGGSFELKELNNKNSIYKKLFN